MPMKKEWHPGSEVPQIAGIYRRRQAKNSGSDRAYWDGLFWRAMDATGRIFDGAHRDQFRTWSDERVNVVDSLKPGDKFWMLSFIQNVGPDKLNHRWLGLFSCDCGNEKAMNIYEVMSGKHKSCGCLRDSKARLEKWLVSCGETKAKNKERQVEGRRKTAAALVGREREKLNVAKSAFNSLAKYWRICSAEGGVLEGWNLAELIRQNSHLFAGDDLIWKKGQCRAYKGINNLKGGTTCGSWKGWRLIGVTQKMGSRNE